MTGFVKVWRRVKAWVYIGSAAASIGACLAAHEYHIAAYASIAMLIEDVLGVLLTQAQARNRADLSGALDSLAWFAGIFTTTWSLNAINGHDTGLKVVVIASVSVANFVGSWTGVKIGERYVKAPAPLAAQVADHDRRLAALEGKR